MTAFRESQVPRSDPLGYVAEFTEWLNEPALRELEHPQAAPSHEAKCAAYYAAESLGYCRLYGIELDAQISSQVAMAAAAEAQTDLERAIEETPALSDAFADAQTHLERHDLGCELLKCRMDAWAVSVAIDETLHRARGEKFDDGDLSVEHAVSESLKAAVGNLADRIAEFDAELLREIEYLTVAAETNLLGNWRSMLAAPYDDPRPWWLDGRLERQYENDLSQSDAAIPSAAWVQRVRRNVGSQKPTVVTPATRRGRKSRRQRVLEGYVGVIAGMDDGISSGESAEVEWLSTNGDVRATAVVPSEPNTGPENEHILVVTFHPQQFEDQTVAFNVPGDAQPLGLEYGLTIDADSSIYIPLNVGRAMFGESFPSRIWIVESQIASICGRRTPIESRTNCNSNSFGRRTAWQPQSHNQNSKASCPSARTNSVRRKRSSIGSFALVRFHAGG